MVQRGLDEARGDLCSVGCEWRSRLEASMDLVDPMMISVQVMVLMALSFVGSEIVRRQMTEDCHRV